MTEQPVRDAFPTLHQLEAALEVAFLVSEEPIDPAQLRNAYTNHASGGVFTSNDLVRGEVILVDAGLLDSTEDTIASAPHLEDVKQLSRSEAVAALVALILAAENPLWLSASTAQVLPAGTSPSLAWEFIPSDVGNVLEEMFEDADRREALLLAAAVTVDSELRREIGEIGEAAIAALCREELEQLGRPDLASNVHILSTISDQLGYDISAPRLGSSSRRIEVKTTGRQGPPYRFFLSRNEAMVGLRDPDWALVVYQNTPEAETAVGWCTAQALEGFLPQDRDARGRWQTVRIDLPGEALRPGIPPASVTPVTET